jgi:GntR family transcriptional regulator
MNLSISYLLLPRLLFLKTADQPLVAQPQPLPLYIRASELLTREIAAGHWRSGERLPTEAELASMLGMAVGTIRKALAELASRGLVERRQGSGTYVREASTSKRSRSIYEFFRLELAEGGGLPTAQVLDFKALKRPAGVPAFGNGGSRDCYRVRRLRLLGGMPVALEEIFFDARHRAGIKAEALGEALYLFYKQQLGFWIAHVEDHVSVATTPAWAPAAFGLLPGAPCGTVERKSWAGSSLLEEYSTTWFDPVRARYTARWH